MKYKRILLKISGEVLGGPDGVGADSAEVFAICKAVSGLIKKGVQVAIVVGGGNFWRYRDNALLPLSRSASDSMGMLATMMNAKLLEEAFWSLGIKAKALAAHGHSYFMEDYSPSKGEHFLKKGSVVILGGGTGNPYFTTDTAAALRALELSCNVLVKDTKVDGIYDSDPKKNKKAKFFPKISYDDFLDLGLGVMDLSAVLLAKENSLPVHVFNGRVDGNLLKVVSGKKIGSIIS
ncbi:MAG: UMP kinase [Candidatus Gracilibacteria bacterium]|jgi:uridylate kinase